jgi:hypothetical protein
VPTIADFRGLRKSFFGLVAGYVPFATAPKPTRWPALDQGAVTLRAERLAALRKVVAVQR